MMAGQTNSGPGGTIINAELDRRHSRPPDYEGENRALRSLARAMATEPDQVLQRLVEEVLTLTRADSAGISLLEHGGEHGQFRWVAMAGAFAHHLNDTVAREASPCGMVIERDELLLLRDLERVFPLLKHMQPRMHENLVVPFHSKGRPVGTVWAIHHTPEGGFEYEDVRLLQSLAQCATAAYQTVQTQAALRRSEERLATIFASAAVGLSEIAQNGRFLRANDELCRILGRTREEVLRLTVMDVTYPDDVPPSLTAVEEALRTNQPASLDKRYLRPDGNYVWANSRVQPLHHEDEPSTLLAVTADLSERRTTEERLRESEERFRALAHLVPVILWRSDASGLAFSENQSFLDYTGQTADEVQDFGWLAPMHPHDRKNVRETFVHGIETKQPIGAQFRLRSRDGQYRWFLARQVPIFGGQGQVTEWFGAAMDVNELHELQQQQAVMVDELQHRTRNLLTVVRAIAQQTMAQTGPTTLFREQFNDRLAALSRVQGLLSRSDQEPITIRALVQMELDALGAAGMRERVAVEGPRVVLRKGSVQTLALALHELATNARKYGALSCEQGELWVSWDIYTAEAGEQRLTLTWLEEGICRPHEDSRIRRGYGRELIEKALPYTLKAHTAYELGENELRCSIDLPLTEHAGARGK
ncbi:PAS domain S-box protein [Methylorubrum extorquens]